MLLFLILGASLPVPRFKLSIEMLSPIATFLGALFGAGISGGIAIYVMHRGIASRKEEKKQEQNDNFKKSFELINMWSNTYLQGLAVMYELIQSNNIEKKKFLGRELSGIELCKSSLDKINDDYIPQKVYKDFLDLKVNMDFTFYQFKAYASSLEHSSLINENKAVRKWIADSYSETVIRYNNHIIVLQDYNFEIDN